MMDKTQLLFLAAGVVAIVSQVVAIAYLMRKDRRVQRRFDETWRLVRRT